MKLKNRIKLLSAAAAILLAAVFAVCLNMCFPSGVTNISAADQTRVDINSVTDLVELSQNYQASPSAYCGVEIYIAIASGELNNLDGFVSLGTSDYPFCGSIVAGSSDPSFTLDKPLFAYIADTAQIKDSSDNARSLEIIRSASNDSALFAENVVHTENSSVTADWQIEISAYTDESGVEHAHSHAGVIGTLGEGAMVDLTIYNNAVTADGVYAAVSSSGDTGLACGTMAKSSALTVSVSGSCTGFDVTSSGGNAGGLVGKMNPGSVLTVSHSEAAATALEDTMTLGLSLDGEVRQDNERFASALAEELTIGSSQTLYSSYAESRSITVNGGFQTGGTVSAAQYAGGIAGYSEDGQVIINGNVNATVNGGSGSGGVFGYFGSTLPTLAISGYNITCTANGANSGGIFGVLENNGGTVSIDNTNSVALSRASDNGSNNNYGGIIGKYSSDLTSRSLEISGAAVTVTKAANAGYYGGIVGVISDDSYVRLSGVSVNASNCAANMSYVFGGLAGYSETAFIDAENVTVNTNGQFIGGGIVGKMNSGVLRFSGKTDLGGTEAKYDNSKGGGQIVGSRENALIYAKDGWVFIRGTAVEVDDIGNWGEVVRFNGTDFTESGVLDVNETAHTVKINAADAANVTGLSGFGALALNMQLNYGTDMGTLLFDSGSECSVLLGSDIELSGNFDLTGTGLTGLTRDDGVTVKAQNNNQIYFTGSITGENCTITLAIGEAYGYRLSQSALAAAGEKGCGIIYRHKYNSLISKTGNGASFSNIAVNGKITVQVIATNDHNNIGALSAIHMAGAFTANNVNLSETITLSGSNGSKYSFVGSMMGRVGENVSSSSLPVTISITNSVFGSEINCAADSRTMASGVIGEISTNYSFSVITDTVTISTKVSNSSSNDSDRTGCFLANIANYGNSYDTGAREVTLTNVTVRDASVSSKGIGGGLLGETWNNTKVTIGGESVKGITVESGTVELLNSNFFAGICAAATGYWQVYDLEIQNITVKGSSASSFGMLINRGIHTDYSKEYALYLELKKPDAFVINSADLSGLKSGITYDDLLATCSANYNTDICENGRAVVSIRTGSGTVQMDGAGCNTYQNQTGRNVTNKNTRYYYNLDLIREKNAAGTLTDPEKLMLWSLNTYAHTRIKSYFPNPFGGNTIPAGSYDMRGYSYYPVDVSAAVTVEDGSSFAFYNSQIESGENGAGNSDSMKRLTSDKTSQHYLMHGGLFRNVTSGLTVSGASFSGSTGVLADSGGSGALVCGTVSGSAVSTVLLTLNNIALNGIKISSVSDYAPLLINSIGSNVKASIKGVTMSNAYTTDKAATSLMGNVGASDADNINITFGGIVLKNDAFSKALLLNSFVYPAGSSCTAVYNFKYAEDWDSGKNHIRNVTYGSEISGSAEYPDMQKQYIDSTYYTDPAKAESTDSSVDFSGYLPYVAAAYSEADNCHEIQVNHKNDTNLETGCGTYNDPYIITKANQLVLIANLLNGSDPTGDGIIINFHTDNYSSWCENKAAHTAYTWSLDEGVFKDENGNTKTSSEMAAALSTAYYKIGSDITLSTGFIGLGKTVPFKGVIEGSDFTITARNTIPFIYQSTGCVVRNLTVKVTADFSSMSTTSYTASSKYATDGDGTAYFYGGLIGIVNGGDNIIDKVSVQIDDSSNIIVQDGSCWGNVAIGGYIGVVRYGGVYFRNMSEINHSGITDNSNNDFTAAGSNSYKGKDGKIRLYLNHIIGRVIDGFAVTETDKYESREANVTMQNGTKNYSIADIDKNAAQLSFSGFSHPTGRNSINQATLTVPNAQSLFIMGCIAMSGAGSAGLNGACPGAYSYGLGQMTRHGEYNEIGNAASADYSLSSKDTYANSKNTVPYIIYKYTPDKTLSADGTTYVSYPARNITNNNFVFTLELAGGNYVLPDGFRGIGSLNSESHDLEMYLYGIKGNNSVIELNMSFNMYRYNYEAYYKINGNKDFKLGLGLFNMLILNRSAIVPTDFTTDTTGKYDDYKISDLTLTGNVKHRVFYSEADTSPDYDGSQSGCAGALGGAIRIDNCTLLMENISLNNLSVSANQTAGGIIGSVRYGLTTINGFSGSNVSVIGGKWAGGLIGVSNNCTVEIDGQTAGGTNGSFTNSTVGSTKGGSFNDGYGAGGIIGNSYNGKNLTVRNVNIENVVIDTTSVANNTIFAGAVIANAGEENDGSSYQKAVIFENITAENTNVMVNDNATTYCGGIAGSFKDSVMTGKITNCHLIGNEDGSSIVVGKYDSGGIMGISRGNLIIDGCSVKNYTVKAFSNSGEGAGGLVGKIEKSESKTRTAVLKNCLISDCVIIQQSGKPAGGIFAAAKYKMGITGSNITLNNVQVTDTNGNAMAGSSGGDVVGTMDSNCSLELVGICVQKAENGKYPNNTVGTNNGSCYVIYSDYDGKCLDAAANTAAPTFNTADDVSDMGAYPYATINPAVSTDGSMLLTGDGISLTAFTNILNGIESSSDTRYKNVDTDAGTFESYKSKLSTFKDKIGGGISDEQNFPVLVINDSNYSNVTSMLNSYIHLLTNNRLTGDKKEVNYAGDNSTFNVEISVLRLVDNIFVEQPDVKTLEISGGFFKMTDTAYDSAYDAQFTLIDVQYYAPYQTGKVAYHLYIPVYVEKMLKFDFVAAALSGTRYNGELYTYGNPVLESYGTPVTDYITYFYRRTPQEWESAINGGENLLQGYGKSVILSCSSNLPADTKLVLVDKNNYGKAYYSTIGEALRDFDQKLDFSLFASADGTAFAPVGFAELLEKAADMTAAQDSNGSLVLCEDDISAATIRVGENYYRKKTAEDTDTSKLYTVTLTPKENMTDETGLLKVYEDYYISFFTEDDSTQPMRNITLRCSPRLGDSGMTPSRMNNANSKENSVHMILGNLYDQTFTFATTGDQVINENNNKVTAEMTAVISLKAENAADVRSYLTYDSIHLYQAFIIEATRIDENGVEKGVKGAPYITGTYTTGDGSYNVGFNCSDSVICFTGGGENAVDIKYQLISGNSVTVTCNDLQIVYGDDTSIIEQFPERKTEDSDYGTAFSASSNLAYVQDNLVHSNISAVPETADGKRYYRENISTVSLNYNISALTPNELSNCGINGRETNGVIKAIGYYSVINVPEADLNRAEKVKFMLSLYQKDNDKTYVPVDIAEYLTEVSLENTTGVWELGGGAGQYTFTLDKSSLKYEAGTFEIATAYSVVTGDAFEQKGYTYANYKVKLEAELLDADGNAISNTLCSDYIIYTNAKIYTNMISAG
ncbi:MAG: hypothetical protein ACI4J1_09050 [Ruminiclostridium sp.]